MSGIDTATSAPPPPLWLHRLAVTTAAITVVLIAAGGLVKSKGAGLAVPDWPQSYGMPNAAIAGGLGAGFLVLGLAWCVWRRLWLAVLAVLTGAGLVATYYLFGPQSSGPVGWYEMPMLRAEHGHRLIAGTVGFLTFILTAAIWEKDERRWVKRLSLAALIAVILQAVLGGLTVHYQLPPVISASHGSLAQAFFALIVTLATVTSPGWFAAQEDLPRERTSLAKLCAWMVAALYLQVVLGTGVRHSPFLPGAATGSGNAHGTAPFYWHLAAHVLGLLFVGHTVARVLVRILKKHSEEARWTYPALALLGVLGVQILLGIGALFLRLQGDHTFEPSTTEYDATAMAMREGISTAHVALGALSLGVAVWMMMQAYRRLAPSTETVTAPNLSAAAGTWPASEAP